MDAHLKAVVSAYVMPVLVINIDHIGGPAIGVKGFATATVEFRSTQSMCSQSGGAGCQVSVAWGLQLSIGAKLLVAFAGHTFVNKSIDQEPIWSHQWPLYSRCLSLSAADTPRDDTYPFFESVQYVGPVEIVTAPECQSMLSIQATMQFVNQSENGYPGFVGSANHNFQRNVNVDVDYNYVDYIDYNIGCIGRVWIYLLFADLQYQRRTYTST